MDVATGAPGAPLREQLRAVPGPPRARRRRLPADPAERVRAMRDAELAGDPADMLTFAGDVILLVKDLAVDPRVRTADKLLAGLGLVYLASPVRLVPSRPALGRLDDLGVAALAARHLLAAAGYDVIHELWRGSEEGLALVLTLAGVQE